MPTGSPISDAEKGQIDGHRSHNLSPTPIAKRIGRHHSTVSKYLRGKACRKQRKKVGRPQKLSTRTKREIVRQAVQGQQSAGTVRKVLKLEVHVRKVQRVLSNAPHIKYLKRKQGVNLTEMHKTFRVNWAKEKLHWTAVDWKNVIFTDEKKFNLDGPDGLQFYWHDLRNEPEIFSKRMQGGRSMIVWGAISYKGIIDVVGIDGKMDSDYYTTVLRNSLIPTADALYGEDWILQQDNASVHRSIKTTEFLDANDVDVLSWPAKSPDLNLLENVWGYLAREVYKGGHQFDSVVDLQDAIMVSWNNLQRSYIRNLFHSIPSRLISVIQRKGGMTTY